MAIMAAGTFLCSIAWGFVLLRIDPFYASTAAFVIFYASFFLTLFGFLSIGAVIIFSAMDRTLPSMFRVVQKSFRFSFAASAIGTALLFLQGSGFLSPITGGSLLFAIVLFFIFRLSLREKEARQGSSFLE